MAESVDVLSTRSCRDGDAGRWKVGGGKLYVSGSTSDISPDALDRDSHQLGGARLDNAPALPAPDPKTVITVYPHLHSHF